MLQRIFVHVPQADLLISMGSRKAIFKRDGCHLTEAAY